MSVFITRVELHDAESEDYDNLHKYMEDEGFSRTISSDANVEYHLPTAEYLITGNYTRSQVLQKAKSAAGKTNKIYGIIVTESHGQTWSGLDKV
jgi:hypothetical protein